MVGHVYVYGNATLSYGLTVSKVDIFEISAGGPVSMMINLDPAGDGIFGAIKELARHSNRFRSA